KDFGKRSGHDIVAHGGGNREVTVLAQWMGAAARAVGVAFVFADVHHQARIESAAVEAVGQGQLEPVGMFAGDGVTTGENLCLHRSRDVHQINAGAAGFFPLQPLKIFSSVFSMAAGSKSPTSNKSPFSGV